MIFRDHLLAEIHSNTLATVDNAILKAAEGRDGSSTTGRVTSTEAHDIARATIRTMLQFNIREMSAYAQIYPLLGKSLVAPGQTLEKASETAVVECIRGDLVSAIDDRCLEQYSNWTLETALDQVHEPLQTVSRWIAGEVSMKLKSSMTDVDNDVTEGNLARLLGSLNDVTKAAKEVTGLLMSIQPDDASQIENASRNLDEVADYLKLHFVKNNFNDLLSAVYWPKR